MEEEEGEIRKTMRIILYINGRPVEIEALFQKRKDGRWENMNPIIFH